MKPSAGDMLLSPHTTWEGMWSHSPLFLEKEAGNHEG